MVVPLVLIGGIMGATMMAQMGPKDVPVWQRLIGGAALGASMGGGLAAMGPAAGGVAGAGASASIGTTGATGMAGGGAGLAGTGGLGLAAGWSAAAPVATQMGLGTAAAGLTPLASSAAAAGELSPLLANAAGTSSLASTVTAPATTALETAATTATTTAPALTQSVAQGAGAVGKGSVLAAEQAPSLLSKIGTFAANNPMKVAGGLGLVGGQIDSAVSKKKGKGKGDKDSKYSEYGTAGWEKEKTPGKSKRSTGNSTTFKAAVERANAAGVRSPAPRGADNDWWDEKVRDPYARRDGQYALSRRY